MDNLTELPMSTMNAMSKPRYIFLIISMIFVFILPFILVGYNSDTYLRVVIEAIGHILMEKIFGSSYSDHHPLIVHVVSCICNIIIFGGILILLSVIFRKSHDAIYYLVSIIYLLFYFYIFYIWPKSIDLIN